VNIDYLRKFTLKQIAESVRAGSTSPVELVELLLEQIHRTDQSVKAYVTVCEDQALESARSAEKQIKSCREVGPLHGIPVSIKDLFETEGVRTSCGSKLLGSHVPKADCSVVRRLKRAGAIILGKLNMHEFALGAITPPTRNPWNLQRIPGGSSGGPAAAIAACSALATIGSDTGGSIRIPASLCGVVGLKPTYGRVSRAGVFPESWSLDHVGPITRRVEDSAFLLSIIAGYDEMDPTSSQKKVPDYISSLRQEVAGLKVGVPRNYFFDRCDDEVHAAVTEAISVLRELRCIPIEFDFPQPNEIMAAQTTIELCESTAFHEPWLASRPDDYTPDVRLLLEQGLFIPATVYLKALRFRGLITSEVAKLFRDFDVIVTPTEPIVAPPVGEGFVELRRVEEDVTTALARYVSPFNLTGLPALSIPCGFSRNGLPIGLQIVGRHFEESTVLQVGQAYEQATDWHMRPAPIM